MNENSTSFGLDVQVVSESATEPVLLVEMKNFLRVDNQLDDSLINSLIKAARIILEKYSGCSFIEKSLIVTYNSVSSLFEIPFGPVRTITSIKRTIDEDEETLAPDVDYEITGTQFQSLNIFNRYGSSVVLAYTAGFATIPGDLKIAIMNQVAFMYENRGDMSITQGAKDLARQYKRNIWNI